MEGNLEELNAQLEQLKEAMKSIEDPEGRQGLQNCIDEIEAVIGAVVEAESSQDLGEGIGGDEYERFTTEIAQAEEEYRSIQANDAHLDLDSSGYAADGESILEDGDEASGSGDKNTYVQKNVSKEELSVLEGMKCLAPHEKMWGQVGFYPAMIAEVVHDNESESSSGGINCISKIKVRVMFLQPVVKSQLVCPFFKENRCRFSDGDCRYSHGEIVHFSQLRDYSDPDYSRVVPSARVLAKYHDDLWYEATVTRLTADGRCEVRFDLDDETCEVEIHETSPLEDVISDDGSEEIDASSEAGGEDEDIVTISCDLLNIRTSEVLGEWEMHTKGIGSKIMMKMGYIIGSGLGKNREGRTIPVDAVMVPPGMSLDHFMELKERRKMGNDAFTVERKLKRAQKRHAAKEKQISENQKKLTSMFDFMNSRLSLPKTNSNRKLEMTNHNIAKQSGSSLKKDMLTVGEDLRKVKKDIAKLTQAAKRAEGRDPTTEALMKNKLTELERRKIELEKTERSISREQHNRSEKRKLTEF